jgi:hypothetical protein
VYFPRSFLEALVNGKRDEFFLFFLIYEIIEKNKIIKIKKKTGVLAGGGREREATHTTKHL